MHFVVSADEHLWVEVQMVLVVPVPVDEQRLDEELLVEVLLALVPEVEQRLVEVREVEEVWRLLDVVVSQKWVLLVVPLTALEVWLLLALEVWLLLALALVVEVV